MLLENKNAVIYGAGGVIGGAVACALTKLAVAAAEISAAGGVTEMAQANTLDEQAVEKHVDDIAGKVESIDILFTLSARKTSRGHRSSTCRSRTLRTRSSSPRGHSS